MEVEYEEFCIRIRDLTGFDLRGYKREQMGRRLGNFLARHGAGSLGELAARLSEEPALLRKFQDFVTINVSEFFRNPEKFAELGDRWLPELLEGREGATIWSAGCSIGAEAYSLAMLIEEIAPRGAHRVLATDIDEGALARAREGLYREEELKALPPAMRARYMERVEGGWRVAGTVRRRVEFRRHDLLHDPYPSPCDLIVCRNVVIYFTEAAKEAIYHRFAEALRPGGILFLGGTECLFQARSFGFEPISPFFYRRCPAAVALAGRGC